MHVHYCSVGLGLICFSCHYPLLPELVQKELKWGIAAWFYLPSYRKKKRKKNPRELLQPVLEEFCLHILLQVLVDLRSVDEIS